MQRHATWTATFPWWIVVMICTLATGRFSARAAEIKLTAPDSATFDYFGQAVAIEGSTAMIGAPRKFSATDDGVAYRFERSGSVWQAGVRLTPSGTTWDRRRIGSSIDMDGNTAILGAPWASPGGSAYVFVKSGSSWSQQARLTGSNTWSLFGCAVAVDGDIAVVGASSDDARGESSGAAYVFRRSGSTWSRQAILTASDGQANQWFGYTVALYGNTIVVGAHPVSSATAGWAYVYQWTGTQWVQRRRFTESDSSDAVAIGDRIIAVGDKWDWNVRVYVYTDTSAQGNWSSYQQVQVSGSDTSAGHFYGSALAIEGDSLVVGAEHAPGVETLTGAAYVFLRSGSSWNQLTKLCAGDGEFGDNFGCSVALSGNLILIGADSADGGATLSGAAYSYDFSPFFAGSGTVTLAGQTNHSGVTITFSRISGTGGTPGPAATAPNGSWSQSGFADGSTYRATPSKANWIFTPAYRDFSAARNDLNFTGSYSPPYTVSGAVTLAGRTNHSGVTLSFSRVTGSGTPPGSLITLADGRWMQSSFQNGTTYRVSAAKTGWQFTPPYRDFTAPTAALNFSGSSADSVSRFSAVDYYGKFAHIYPQTQQAVVIRSDLPQGMQALARSPSGELIAVASGVFYAIDPDTGSWQQRLQNAPALSGMAFSPSGDLFGARHETIQPSPDHLLRITWPAGQVTDLGALQGGDAGAQGLAFSPAGVLYGIVPHSHTAGTYALYTIDTDDCQMHLAGWFSSADLSQGIAFTPDGSLYAIGAGFARINPATGAVIGNVLTLPAGDFRALEASGFSALSAVKHWRCYGQLPLR